MASTTAASALVPAQVGTRVIAYIIDGLILTFAAFFVIVPILISAVIQGDPSLGRTISASVLYAIISFFYFGYTWTSWRASPGQRLMGLSTVDANTGAALTWSRAGVRWAYLFGPSALQSIFTNSEQVGGFLSFIVSLALIGYYIYLLRSAMQDARGQAYHDKQSSTIVVRTETSA